MKFQLLFIFLLMFVFSFEAMAVKSIATVDGDNTTVLVKNEQQKTNVFKKISNWIQVKKLKATTWVVKKLMAIDFNEPSTALKFGLISLALGFVFIILGIFIPFIYYLGYLLWLAGCILIFYWIYLKFIK